MKLFLFVFAVVATFSAISTLEEMGELEEIGECSLSYYLIKILRKWAIFVLPLTFDNNFLICFYTFLETGY